MEYTRLQDLDRLLDALEISKHARPISPAEVFELCLEEIRSLKQFDTEQEILNARKVDKLAFV